MPRERERNAVSVGAADTEVLEGRPDADIVEAAIVVGLGRRRP